MKKLKTYPSHWLDIILWPILKIIWEPFSKKESHFWHWSNYKPRLDLVIATVYGDHRAGKRNGFISNLIQTNFSWQKIAILKPNTEKEYQIGFMSDEGDVSKSQVCSIILHGECAALVGPYDVKFFAISYPEAEQIYIPSPKITIKEFLSDKITLI